MRRVLLALLALLGACGNPIAGGNAPSTLPNHFLIVVDNQSPAFVGSQTTFVATWWFATSDGIEIVSSTSTTVARGSKGILDCGTIPPDGVEINTPSRPRGFGYVLQAAGNDWPCWTPNYVYPSDQVTYVPPQ